MPARDIVEEMNEYYRVRAPWHDDYMSYTDRAAMEELLRPVIEFVEPFVDGRHVLEIACGTGNWTQILARRARSVLAMDINESMLEIARSKFCAGDAVSFLVDDAYGLTTIRGGFTAAFSADWWSHVPIGRLRAFLELLHTKLAPGSHVVFVDMLPRDHPDLTPYRRDEEGNLIHRRSLPNGREFDVLKNFPSRGDVLAALDGVGRDPVYSEHLELRRWAVAYST
jgi:demethylmenaquinone methyltransferase/2-methoxy-6-polyprenyl-1,4-benzoquinol methylase